MFRETFKKYGQLILVFTILMLIYLGLTNLDKISNFISNLFSVLSPFLLGLLFALLLLTPCKAIERNLEKSKFKFFKKRRRGLSVLFTYIMVLSIIVLLLQFALPAITSNIAELISNIPGFYNSAVEYVTNIPEDSWLNSIDFSFILNNISLENIQNYFNIERIFSYLKGVINFATTIFSLFVAIILSVYILLDREKILNFISRFMNAVFGKKMEHGVIKYLHKTISIFSKFISAQFMDAIVIGTLCSITLMILDVKYALTLGPLIGLANMIPYFGAIFAAIVAIIITIFTGGFWKALTVLIFILILQQIDANIINPKILSDNLKTTPLLVILAVTVGGGFFGVIGMFLGVPVFVTIKAIIMDYIESK